MAQAAETAAEAPLSPDERRRADRAARRMHSEMRSLIASMAPDHRTASGLARALAMDRTTCQRLVSAVRGPYEGPDLLVALPGTRGLRTLLKKARQRRLAPAERLDGADAAIERFDQTVARLAGSRAKLAQRLETQPGAADGDAPAGPYDPDLPARRAVFESAASLTGRWSESWVAVYVYHPAEDDPRRLETPRAFGLLGHHATPAAVPLVFHNFSSDEPSDPKGTPQPGILGPAKLRTTPAVLDQFSTSPVPLVSTASPGEFMVQSIDLDEDDPDASVDLMLAATGSVPHPRTKKTETEELWALVNFPARRLVLDAYLPAEEARASIPSLAVHLWGPDFASDQSRRWQTRFDRAPTLQLLGKGLANARTIAHDRHEELTRFLFDNSGLDPDEYVGVRCEVEYPIWRAGYCITFDYATG